MHTIEKRYLRAAENFGVSRKKLFLKVVFPATLPEIIVGMRIGLGVAWLVVVAAEMIALRSGLGYLIIDSRNAGNRYDLVIAGMIIIGLIGLMLDGIMRLLESMKVVTVALCPLSLLMKIAFRTSARASTNDKVHLQVIEGLDFEIGEGEFVAIVGPSGCGKTTLMNIIAGFLAPDSGAVQVNGVVRDGPNRKGIMITQQGSVFPWLTVKQNLLFGLPDELPNREALADEYAALVGPQGFREQLSARTVGRHAEARGDRARAGREARDHLHG